MSSTAPLRSDLEWPEHEPYEDVTLGNLKSSKEAEIFLVERRYASGPRLLAHKRFDRGGPPRASCGRGASATRPPTAVTLSTAADGHSSTPATNAPSPPATRAATGRSWPASCGPCSSTLAAPRLDAGASVLYPVQQTDHGLLMEYIGDESMAAPKLAQARLEPDALAPGHRLHANLQALTEAGLVHADLSVYNLLWWEGRLVLIDLPQAVEFTTNADAWDLLHRDVANVGDWFTRHGLPIDVEEVYADLLTLVRDVPCAPHYADERSGETVRHAISKAAEQEPRQPGRDAGLPQGRRELRPARRPGGRPAGAAARWWSEQVKPIAGTESSSITSALGCPVAP